MFAHGPSGRLKQNYVVYLWALWVLREIGSGGSLPFGTPPLSASKQKLLGGDPPFEPPPFQQASNDNQKGRPPFSSKQATRPRAPYPLHFQQSPWSRGAINQFFHTVYYSFDFVFRPFRPIFGTELLQPAERFWSFLGFVVQAC